MLLRIPFSIKLLRKRRGWFRCSIYETIFKISSQSAISSDFSQMFWSRSRRRKKSELTYFMFTLISSTKVKRKDVYDSTRRRFTKEFLTFTRLVWLQRTPRNATTRLKPSRRTSTRQIFSAWIMKKLIFLSIFPFSLTHQH